MFKTKDIKSMIAHLTNPSDVADYLKQKEYYNHLKTKVREQVKDGALLHPKNIGYIRGVLKDEPGIVDLSDEELWDIINGKDEE